MTPHLYEECNLVNVDYSRLLHLFKADPIVLTCILTPNFQRLQLATGQLYSTVTSIHYFYDIELTFGPDLLIVISICLKPVLGKSILSPRETLYILC